MCVLWDILVVMYIRVACVMYHVYLSLSSFQLRSISDELSHGPTSAFRCCFADFS